MLSPRQEKLEQALRAKNASLAGMYVSALRVLADDDIVDGLALAAHGIRELIEKLPEHLDVPAQMARQRLTPRVRELEKEWTAMVRKTTALAGDIWSGTIDGHLHEFLVRVRDFFERLAQDFPQRRQAARAVLRKLNLGPVEIAPPLEAMNVKVWMELNDYFVRTAHHHGSDIDTFNDNLTRLEHLLLNGLSPSTFEDYAEIDKILAEDDPDAK